MVFSGVRILMIASCALGALIVASQMFNRVRRANESPFGVSVYLARRRMEAGPKRNRRQSEPTSTVKRSLIRVLALNALEVDPEEFFLTVIAWWCVISTVAFTVGLSLNVAMELDIISSVMIGCLAILTVAITLDTRATNHAKSLNATLPALIERFGILVGAGKSVTTAVAAIAGDQRSPWSYWFGIAVVGLGRGSTLQEELTAISSRIQIDSFDRFAELLSDHALTPELPQLINSELKSLRRRQRMELVEILEKRSQLVWIPVSIAILIPGTLLLAIPLLNSLKFFAGV